MVTSAKTKWSAAYHRFGTKFDHALICIEWQWRLRMCKSQPQPCYEEMTPQKWEEFDRRLEVRLGQLQGDVEITEQAMGEHYDQVAKSIRDTIQEVVPPRAKAKYNGRTVSEKTKRLYDLRTRDFASGREIKKSDRDAWNKTLGKAAKKDYDDWVNRWVETMEEADEKGDVRKVYEGARALAGKSKNGRSTQPTKKKNGDIIQSEEELGELWQQFLEGKFSATELEEARQEYEPLGPAQASDTLTYEEFAVAVKRMKLRKAVGPDGVPAEVWKRSALANQEVYFFLKHVWEKECVPKTLVLCAFVMLYKKKGSSDDCSKYHALGLLNHAYKIMAICLLNRMVKETEWFMPEWQAGFRNGRGCRDNVLLLRVIYDQIIRGNNKCVITYIDFEAAFDSVSHKFLDAALKKANASRKTRAMFRVIYAAAQGAARVLGKDGKYILSKVFEIARGVIQGDIISPIFFIIALAQLVQEYDTSGTGISIGHINAIRVLGYADDAAMTEWRVQDMTTRLTEFADAAVEHADMKVKLSKTYSQIVCRQEKVGALTEEAIKKMMKSYKYACTFAKAGCTQRFKTKKGMAIHACSCSFNYGRTEEAFPVEEVLEVFGKATRKLFLVQWEGYPGQDSWVPEDSLIQDGCAEAIKEFWIKSGKNPAQNYYADPDGDVGMRYWMCGWKSDKTDKVKGLRMHIRMKDHKWTKKAGTAD